MNHQKTEKKHQTPVQLVNKSIQTASILQDEHQKEVINGNTSFNTRGFAGV